MRSFFVAMVFFTATAWIAAPTTGLGAELLVEAESFSERGGWILDPQFMDVMGSPYLLAHGLGRPVQNASTEVEFPAIGEYRVWVRTKDWVPSHHPGRFTVSVNEVKIPTVFGTQGTDWMWQDGGTISVSHSAAVITLSDRTGFDGRCDAIFFTTDHSFIPPNEPGENATSWRTGQLGLPETPPTVGRFDVVVVGGGIPGCSAALASARLGLTVAFIQNRPWLGGNASNEIGLFPRGVRDSIVAELVDSRRINVIRMEDNIDLYLGWHAMHVVKTGDSIDSVDAKCTTTNKVVRFEAPLFIDCTGVGAVGVLAGADFRMGREARSEFRESLAPETADEMHHGNTVIFRTRLSNSPTTFPDVPWALDVSKGYAELGGQVLSPGRDNVQGLTHFWEYGQWLDPFQDAEHIRDHLFCAIYGTFATVKRRYSKLAEKVELEYVGHVPAGGESRRLMGDHILTENEVRSQGPFFDTVAINSGHFCLHYPGDEYDFRLSAKDWKFIPVKPFPIPFRCLYSRNVANLMMAGKHISVSHIAGASTKTMLNGGQAGLATGAAAFLCKKYGVTPRELCRTHVAELQDIVFARGEYRDSLHR